jgi:glycosyltransferase involved in cell wall biosynthesis
MTGAPPAAAASALSVVIPAFNEAAGLARQLQDLTAVLNQSGWRFEVIVVDDGSTDGTAEVAESCGIRVLPLPVNGGYGSALKAGISAARYDWILITDADGTYPPEAIPSLLARATAAGMVVGARVGANVQESRFRKPAKWLLRQYASLIAMQAIPDLNSGMRLMWRPLVRQFWDLLPAGFSFTTTITLSMLAAGHPVAYVPIDYLPRIGQSKIRPWDFFRFARLITRMALHFRPLRLFVPVGLLVAAASLASFRTVAFPAACACAFACWVAGLALERKARRERTANP